MASFQRLVAGFLEGSAFGVSLEKGSVHDPLVIQDQMRMRRFAMVRMFLSASATGSLVFSALALLDSSAATCSIKPFHPLAQSLGGALLGVGMAITGACPGTVHTQLGAGVPSAPLVVLGGLLGSALYGYCERALTPTVLYTYAPYGMAGQALSLPRLMNVPYPLLGIPFAGAMIVLLILLERIRPLRKESGYASVSPLGLSLGMSKSLWSPYVSGILVGLLQLPSYLTNGSGLGTSSAYVTLAALVLLAMQRVIPAIYLTPYLLAHANSAPNQWQLALDIGIIVGAFVSAKMSGNFERWGVNRKNFFSTETAKWVLGGAVLLFGARMANGCTSGHGLSGMSQLALSSLVATPAMFAGGMAVAALAPSWMGNVPIASPPSASSKFKK